MVVMFGTVIFSVMEGKPRLVIFLNQEEEEIRQARDFIAPQVTFTAGSRFRGIFYPPGVKAAGAVAAAVDVDASGRVRGSSLISEHPPGLGFGAQVVGGIRDAVFIPGFRNGKPAACRFTMPGCVRRTRRTMEDGPEVKHRRGKGIKSHGLQLPRESEDGVRRLAPVRAVTKAAAGQSDTRCWRAGGSTTSELPRRSDIAARYPYHHGSAGTTYGTCYS